MSLNSAADPLPTHRNSAVGELRTIAPNLLIEIIFSVSGRRFSGVDKRFSAAGTGMLRGQATAGPATQGFASRLDRIVALEDGKLRSIV